MQNAVEHAFPLDRRSEGNVTIRLERDADQIVVTVADDGVGLPERFSLDSAKGLGLSIVQTLVTGELGGTLEVDAGHPGTRATITVRSQAARRSRISPPAANAGTSSPRARARA